MAITKNITTWYQPKGQGYISGSGQLGLLTQSGVQLLTQSGEDLITNPNIYSPKFVTGWTKSTKEITVWRPSGGVGYIATQGILDFVDNLGHYITDNLGNNIVTTPGYVTGKNITKWTASGI